MSLYEIDSWEVKEIVDGVLARLDAIAQVAAATGWQITGVSTPGNVELRISLHSLPRYAPADETRPELSMRILRHVERLMEETETRVLRCSVDMDSYMLMVCIRVNANLVSLAIEQTEAFDHKRRSDHVELCAAS